MSVEDRAAIRARLAAELRSALAPQLLEAWYPRALDPEHGGFHEELSLDFEVLPQRAKTLVPQARHVWTTSKAAQLLSEDPRYARAAEHGFRYLRDVMWDGAHGGFLPRTYANTSDGVWPGAVNRRSPSVVERLKRVVPRNRVTRLGAALLRRRAPGPAPMVKTSYGQAFAIYGLAAYVEHSGDAEALDLAREAFAWFDAHAHDDAHGGYASFLDRAGSPLEAGPRGQPPKDFNTILHVVEAFTELYRVWPDALLERRLGELVDLMCDRMIADRGTSWTTFEANWTPIRLTEAERRAGDFAIEQVSFGHDIEAGALLIDAADALGLGADVTPRRLAKQLVDHSLDHGWDAEHGGLFLGGYYFEERGPCEIVDRAKVYWAQAEAVNTLSLMATLFPDDPRDYLARLDAQWVYCRRYLIDHARGGWYFRGLDFLPEAEQPWKGRPVHGTYHVGRALMNGWLRLSGPGGGSGRNSKRPAEIGDEAD